MGVFIARRAIHELAKVGIGAVGTQVLVLGLTFRENCPDLRNSKVPGITEELTKYGCEVLVHDPYCDPKEAKSEYGIDLIKEVSEIAPISAIVLAVAHKPFKQWSLNQWLERLQAGRIVVDVKGIIPKEELVEAGVKIWRL